MFRKFICFLIIYSAASGFKEASSQAIDTITFQLNSRLGFYSFEQKAEMLLHLPASFTGRHINMTLKIDGDSVYSWKGYPGRKILRVPFPINLPAGVYKTEVEIVTIPYNSIKYSARTNLIILKYKPNEVKTDRLTGGLIVNKREFFPFGFYTYSPVFPTLPEEEVIKGFNMISPYQKILPETLNERKAYMDRCAQLGMKVHYNLLSVSGGGGVGSKIEGISDEEKKTRLLEEIKTFMNHPALLAWYISDEPTGNKIIPEQLEEIYKMVKETDPWHPVSIVFMAPFLTSKKYADALDIVMADPYPLPDLSASMVGDIAGQLKDEFTGKKPVWIVPQAFGGGELWKREPTIQEIRSMTYQALINGATGIQYFVRQGLNYFPKSTATWGECGRMAMEVAELTPWLLSEEETLSVETNSRNVIVSSKLHNGQLIVMVVNIINEPVKPVIRISGINNAKARSIFENRSVPVNGGAITDPLAPFGSQVYLINVKPEKQSVTTANTNLIKDPGFEDLSSPGVPSACYARPGGDRGATYFLDTREHFEQAHSLRIITPVENQSLSIRFFPVPVKAGASYIISLWAKSDPEQRFLVLKEEENVRLTGKRQMPQFVEILLGEFSRARFVPDSKWREYVTFVTIPSDTTGTFKTNLILKMPGQGVAWFDQVKVIEEK